MLVRSPLVFVPSSAWGKTRDTLEGRFYRDSDRRVEIIGIVA